MRNRTILYGDVLEKLQEIEPNSIDCVITSPPYWGLRDYGVLGQWGLESDFKDYLMKMGQFMVRLKRVLKSTGTVWINLGDTYAGGVSHSDWSGVDKDFHSDQAVKTRKFKAQIKEQLEPKTRYGIPERFYIECIDSGWIARNHIAWVKGNAMPSSVKDRFSNKWESIFFFAKNQKYYFNLDAVREKTISETKPFNIRVRENITGHAQAKLGDKSWTASEKELKEYNKNGERKQDNLPGKNHNLYKGFNQRWKNRKWSDVQGQETQTMAKNHYGIYDENGNNLNNPNGKNPGDVFFINPRPFPEAHFATFPIDLPLKILKCACPPDGIVLDPFFGSGTVGLAAEKLGLNWVGIELKKEYTEISNKRLGPYNNIRLEAFQ